MKLGHRPGEGAVVASVDVPSCLAASPAIIFSASLSVSGQS